MFFPISFFRKLYFSFHNPKQLKNTNIQKLLTNFSFSFFILFFSEIILPENSWKSRASWRRKQWKVNARFWLYFRFPLSISLSFPSFSLCESFWLRIRKVFRAERIHGACFVYLKGLWCERNGPVWELGVWMGMGLGWEFRIFGPDLETRALKF